MAAQYLQPENFTFITVGQPEGLEDIPTIYADEIKLIEATEQE